MQNLRSLLTVNACAFKLLSLILQRFTCELVPFVFRNLERRLTATEGVAFGLVWIGNRIGWIK